MILLLATEIIVIFMISSELLFSANIVRLAQHEQCWPAVHRSRQGVAFSERILTDAIQCIRAASHRSKGGINKS